jgi:hypothetical protein
MSAGLPAGEARTFRDWSFTQLPVQDEGDGSERRAGIDVGAERLI